jgi:hypothetical protein
MRGSLLCDNDVVLKGCCYDLSLEILLCLGRIGEIYILGSAQYVIQNRIARSKTIAHRLVAAENFEVFFSAVQIAEPSDEEVRLAAEFEAEAQTHNLALDSGESLLLAILLARNVPLLVTGDKRAITSTEMLSTISASAAAIKRRIACIEQMFLSLLKYEDFAMLQLRVCQEPKIDVALSNCFTCASGSGSRANAVEGLTSYVKSLQNSAARVLIGSSDLSSVIP